MMMFRSIEIYFIEEGDEKNKQKLYTPIYVPVYNLKELMSVGKNKIEVKILDNIKYDESSNCFTYVPKDPNSEKKISPKKRSPSKVRNKFDEKVQKPTTE
ncbi:MAG TPA: hypothetical protein VHA52_03915 [Candidatus Babeliaceae bacterium]|nr:hypothetical protein [Candidatus Babeliaceae bacterium]